jgi:hypothetical protein
MQGELGDFRDFIATRRDLWLSQALSSPIGAARKPEDSDFSQNICKFLSSSASGRGKDEVLTE